MGQNEAWKCHSTHLAFGEIIFSRVPALHHIRVSTDISMEAWPVRHPMCARCLHGNARTSNAPTLRYKLSLSQSQSCCKVSDRHPNLTSNGKRLTLLYLLTRTRTRRSHHQHRHPLSSANASLRQIYHSHMHTRYNVQPTDPPTRPRMVCICICSDLHALTQIRSHNPYWGGGGCPTKYGHSCRQR
jgi:hypothetical protein